MILADDATPKPDGIFGKDTGKSAAEIDAYWITPGKQSPLSSFIDYDKRPFR